MKEQIDKKLVDEWEKNLKSAGLPSPDEKPPVEVSLESFVENGRIVEVDHSLISEEDLQDFAKLPRKFRQDIIKDIKEKKEGGTSAKELASRVRMLTDQHYKFIGLKNDALDLNHEKEEIDRRATIDRMIKELEDTLDEDEIAH